MYLFRRLIASAGHCSFMGMLLVRRAIGHERTITEINEFFVTSRGPYATAWERVPVKWPFDGSGEITIP